MNKFISIITVSLALGLSFTSCSDDDVYNNEVGSQIIDGHTIFYLPSDYLELGSDVAQIEVNLLPENGHQEYSIVAHVARGKGLHLIKLPLEKISQINDGVYVMTFRTPEGNTLKSKINVEFKNNMLHRINYRMAVYDLGKDCGTGTMSDPYMIRSAEAFDKFKGQLKNDAEKGRGQYFLQDTSFVALYDYGDTNRGYGCEEFAGNYDGGKNSITYEYFGSGNEDVDYNRGLFSVLRDGASVSNLTIKASMKNVTSNAGALAGVVNGNVEISNVYFHTDISSQSGYDNAQNIGGLIGKLENANLTVSNAGTLDEIISVSGKNNVGGLIGYVDNSSFNIKGGKIIHELSDANRDVTPIYSSSNYAGGLIGRVNSTSGPCFMNVCEVKTGIRTVGDYSGGLIGAVNSGSSVSITDCKISSYVKGNRFIGGLVGLFSGSGQVMLSGANEIKNKSIIGVGSMGGAFGKLDDTNFSLSGTTKVMLGQDGVVGSGGRIGGFIGEVVSTDVDFDYNSLVFNNAIEVSGKMSVGGIVGELVGSKLSGANIISYSSTTIPQSSKFNANFTGNVDGDSRVGGAVGFATGSTIDGIYANANVIGTDSIGGIVGSAELSNTNCMIEDCIFNGTLKATGKDIGGICGKFTKDGRIHYCINYGSVEGRENVGGVAGAANYGEMTQSRTFLNRCVNVGAVTGTTDVAGIVGFMHGDDDYYVQVTSCANYGSIQGGSSTTGGIVGLISHTKGRIYYSVNHGTVHSTGACRTGGIIGKMGKDPTGAYQSTNLEIGWCANTGKVVCDGDSEVGGIVGYAEEGAVDWKDHDSWVHDCYNTGAVSESGKEAAGIIGYSDRYCYLQRLVNYGDVDYAIVGDYKYGPELYDDNTYYTKGSGTKYIADTYLSDPGNKDSYENFDFEETWQISDEKAILQEGKCPFQNVTYNP